MAVNIDKISEQIIFHRKEAGLTQKQLADIAGVGKTVIFDIENNKSTVKFNTLQKVLNALNIKIKLETPLKKNKKDS